MPSAPSRLRRSLLKVPVAVSLLFLPAQATSAVEVGRITGFTLINAETGVPVHGYDPIPADATIRLSELPTSDLNIQVNTAGPVESVRIMLNARRPRVELNEPYAVLGNSAEQFKRWTPSEGKHRVTATPLVDGDPLRPATLTFSVVDDGPAGEPSDSPGSDGEAAPLPTRSLAPSSSGATDDAPSSNNNRCGSIPAAPTGWQRAVTSTFSEETRLGDWPGPVTGRDWRGRTAGWRDSSGRGIYDAGRTVSERDGMLDVWVHSEGERRYVAAPVPTIGNVVGMRVDMCMRADRIPGYKIAFLLWPRDGDGNDQGEIDFPEGKLLPTSKVHGFVHYDPKPASGKNQDGYATGVSSEEWHRYTLEWDPGSASSQTDDYVSFFLDGQLVGRTTGAKVPDGPMHYVMQIETYLAGQDLPAPAQGHVQVDWVTIDLPN